MSVAKQKTCAACGAGFVPRSRGGYGPPICSPTCRAKRRAERTRTLITTCRNCPNTVVLRGSVVGTPPYCSDECRVERKRSIASATLSRINREHASARMTARNPMRLESARAKMSATLRSIGHAPPTRGGNGKPTPEPQRLLAEALGWPVEVVVPTRMDRGTGFPRHYKLDIASREDCVAVEVDGGSHAASARREQDARKDAFLTERGWRVLRFTNAEVLADVERCARIVRAA